jgi:glycosyltransferase involved in cell wall biosynthesis
MDGPLVSVIVGVYNKERFVGECLRSVLVQTYSNWELIVVDDASTDGSWNVIQEVAREDARVMVVKRTANSGGCGVARNEGSKLAQGEIFMFLDADDVWCEEKMRRQVEFMETHPACEFCHARCWKVDEEGRVLGVRHENGLPDCENYSMPLLERMWVSISTVAVRRTLWKRLGGFIEDCRWGGEEDLELSLRCAQMTEFGTIQEPLAKYRVSGGNWTAKKWKGVGRDYVAYRKVYGRSELWRAAKTEREMRALLSDMAVEGCQYWRARGEWCHAGWFALQSVLRAPFSANSWRQVLGVLAMRR